MLASIYDWVIRAIFSAAAGILGGVAVILFLRQYVDTFSLRVREL